MIDWTAFRSDFEREAGRILGRQVVVRGDASARLLPFPSLTFTDVVVANPDAPGGVPLMTLGAFSMDAELAPYLSGEIRIFQMRLTEPHLTLPVGGGEEGLSFAGLPDAEIILENVEVTDGRITFIDRFGASRVEIGDLSGAFSAGTLRGPYGGGGTLNANGEPFAFSLSTGTIAADGAWPIRLTLSSQAYSTAVTIDGATRLGDGRPDLDGRVRVVSPLPDADGGTIALLPPVLAEAGLSIGAGAATLSELRAEVGGGDSPYVLTGSGAVDFSLTPRFDLTLEGQEIDVDALAGMAQAPVAADIGLAERLEAVRRTFAAVPVPPMPGTVSLRLPVVTAGDTTIRNTAFVGSPDAGGWAIDSLSAELPGRTLVEASGRLDVEPELSFSGDLLVASRQVAAFSEWLGKPTVPALSRLERAGFSARAALSAASQDLQNLEIDVGGQRLLGSLQRTTGNGETVVADLSGDAVDLDAFAAFARLFTGDDVELLAARNLDLRLDAGPVAYDGMRAGRVNIDLAYAGDTLDLRGFVATNLAGADIEAQGTVADLFGDPKPELAFDLMARDPNALAALAAERLPDSPLAAWFARHAADLAPLSLAGSLALPIEDGAPALAVRLDGAAAGTQLDLRLSLENGLAAAQLDGRFGLEASLANERPAELLRQFGLGGIDLGLPGPLDARLTLSGAAERATTGRLEITTPGSAIAATGSVQLGYSGVEGAELRLDVESDDAGLWATAAGLSLAQDLDAVPVDLDARLSWFGGDWAVNSLVGAIGDSRVGGSLRAARGGGVAGEISADTVSLPWFATLVYGTPPSLGISDEWSAEPFGESLLNIRPVDIAFRAERLELSADRALEDFTAAIAVRGGEARISDASAAFADGRLTGDVRLNLVGGQAGLEANLAIDAAAGETLAPGLVRGRVGGALEFVGSGRSYAELAQSLTGEGRVVLRDAAIPGIRAGILPAILEAADPIDAAIDTAALLIAVESLPPSTGYPVGDLDRPLGLALGRLTVEPFTLETVPGETIGIDASYGVEDERLTASAVQIFQPPEEEIYGEAVPSLRYALDGRGGGFVLTDAEPLAGYLAARRLQREQERLVAIRDDLNETLRLRRETRFFESRRTERARAAAAAAEAERQAAIAVQEAERARAAEAAEAAAAAAEAAEAERRRAAAAAAAAVAPRPSPPVAASQPTPPRQAPPAPAAPQSQSLNFDITPPAGPPPSPQAPAPSRPATSGFGGLPGVTPPLEIPNNGF